jgi:hypothetical protein
MHFKPEVSHAQSNILAAPGLALRSELWTGA